MTPASVDPGTPRTTSTVSKVPKTSIGPIGWALAIVALLVLCASVRPLMLPDEGRYVGVAWEMLQHGRWLTPTLDGLPYFHKPPLFYWITAAALRVFGHHAAAARAAPMLGAAIGTVSMGLFARRWWGPRAARAALVALLGQPLWWLGAQFANLDMLVAGTIAASILSMAHAVLQREAGARWRAWVVAGWTLAALAVLAKGLIGLVLPALVIGTWLLARRQWRTIAALLQPAGIAAFVLVAAPWFVAMDRQYAGFTHYFFIVQHVQRYAQTGFNNAQPFWFYGALLALAWLPWLGWLRGLPAALRRPGGDGTERDGAQRASLRLLMLAWAVVVTLFFSLPHSKLIGYILPAIPPIAMLVADGFERVQARSARARRAWIWTAAGMAFASLAVIATLALRPSRTTAELGAELARHHAAGQAIYALDGYPFDLGWTACLSDPIHVVQDWDDAQLMAGDTWRRELADAAAFDPAAAAGRLLLPRDLPAALCAAAGPSWIIAPTSAAQRHRFLAQGPVRVRTVREMSLWRVDPAALQAAGACGQRPNGD